MVRGAFRSMRHTHEFFPTETGTRVVDTLEFTSPLGWIGRWADVLFLERYMRSFLETRNQFVRHVAEADRRTKPCSTN
jgi:ligand-binding SRPBCC domain-containing protein